MKNKTEGNYVCSCDICNAPETDMTLLQYKKGSYLCTMCVSELWKTAIVYEPEVLEDFNKFLENDLFKPQSNANGQQRAKPDKDNKHIKQESPKQIHAFLNDYVIDQEQAKKTISVAVYNHYKRILNNQVDENEDVEIEKSNIVLVGNTGTGKTLIAKTIAKILQVPFAIADATVFTEAGYVGEDVESILTRLLQDCDYDIAKAEKGIVYIDEIDKLSRKRDNPSITRDVSGEGVQQGLLKLLEGSKVLVPPEGGRKHPDQKMLQIDTRNILFICGGAFDGIEKIISKRINVQPIGFSSVRQQSAKKKDMLSKIISSDLKNFGLIPELLGRLPVVSYLLPLDKEALKNILLKPKNALLKQYTHLFKLDNISLHIQDDAINTIVDKAIEVKLGARGLRSICELVLIDWMYELPNIESKKVVITKRQVIEKLDKFYSSGKQLSA